MASFVALLRGVNVGKGKRVPMAELRRLVEGTGASRVRTLLNSGNVVFDRPKAASAKVAASLAAAIEAAFGFPVPVVVKSASEFAAILDANPLQDAATDHARRLVVFTQRPDALRALAPLASLAAPPEVFVVGKHAAYLHCPGGVLDSEVGLALLGKAGAAATTRNWATCLKLRALLDERDA